MAHTNVDEDEMGRLRGVCTVTYGMCLQRGFSGSEEFSPMCHYMLKSSFFSCVYALQLVVDSATSNVVLGSVLLVRT